MRRSQWPLARWPARNRAARTSAPTSPSAMTRITSNTPWPFAATAIHGSIISMWLSRAGRRRNGFMANQQLNNGRGGLRMALKLNIPREALADFCRRNHIRRLAFFGSVLREDFGPDSDLDILVEFEPGHVPGLAFFGLQDELSNLLGRQVDLNTPGCFRPELRDRIEQDAEVVYG